MLNLYGHPLAGLLRGKFQESKLFKLGFEKVKSWECLCVHHAKQLFLLAYGDDYKMAGRKQSIAPMWAALRAEGLDLEPPVPLNENFYLGCSQVEIVPDPVIISGKREAFKRLCFSGPTGKPETAGGDPELLDNLPGKTAEKKRKKQKQTPTSSSRGRH